MLNQPSKIVQCGVVQSGTKRRGTALIYATAGILVLGAFAALAVDWGRVQLTKTELQSAADAAARYGAAGLQNDLDGVSAASANAAASASQNKANGQAISFNASQDVVIGEWNKGSRTFAPTTDLNKANAVQVTLRCTQARGTAVPLAFMSMLGRKTSDVTAVSIAMVDYSGVTGGAGNGRFEYFIPATDNPWLSGEPSGTIASVNNPHANPDYAGTPMTDSGSTKNADTGRGGTAGGSTDAGSANSNYAQWGDYAAKKASPVQAGGFSISSGMTLTLDGINGGATNAAGQSLNDADGNTGYVVNNSAGAENGIADVNAPLNSVIGVFLNDSVPNANPLNVLFPPSTLDFSTAAQRDFKSLSPGLRQPFFIGDGRTSTGEVQQFVAPTGATRLFICTMDSYEWSNNVGGFYVTAHVKGKIVTVK